MQKDGQWMADAGWGKGNGVERGRCGDGGMHGWLEGGGYTVWTSGLLRWMVGEKRLWPLDGEWWMCDWHAGSRYGCEWTGG